MAENVDVAAFMRVKAAASSGKPQAKIYAQMRKSLKKAAEIGAAASREEVGKSPLEPGARHKVGKSKSGLRAGIASGIRVKLVAKEGPNTGAIIMSTGSGLDGNRKKLVKRYNREGGWRHPVFASYGKRKAIKSASHNLHGANRRSFRNLDKALGERERGKATWVNQKGRPYFGTIISKKQSVITAMVEQALTTASEEIAALENK